MIYVLLLLNNLPNSSLNSQKHESKIKSSSSSEVSSLLSSFISVFFNKYFLTFEIEIGTTDTIDCTIAGAAAATGRLRVYATVIDCNDHGAVDRATEVDRDLLA